MNSEDKLSEQARKKLRIYFAATFLFDKGKSHPQVVEILEEYEPDRTLLIPMVDKAMFEVWDILFQDAKQLYADGLSYD